MDYITTVEMSKKWGISSRRISLLCSQGRVPGAEKKGKTYRAYECDNALPFGYTYDSYIPREKYEKMEENKCKKSNQ